MDYEGRKSCIRFVFYSQSLLLFSKPMYYKISKVPNTIQTKI